MEKLVTKNRFLEEIIEIKKVIELKLEGRIQEIHVDNTNSMNELKAKFENNFTSLGEHLTINDQQLHAVQKQLQQLLV